MGLIFKINLAKNIILIYYIKMTLIKIVRPIYTIRISGHKLPHSLLQCLYWTNRNELLAYQMSRTQYAYYKTHMNKKDTKWFLKYNHIPSSECKFLPYEIKSSLNIYYGECDNL